MWIGNRKKIRELTFRALGLLLPPKYLATMWQIFILSIQKPSTMWNIIRLQQYSHYFTFIPEVKHYTDDIMY